MATGPEGGTDQAAELPVLDEDVEEEEAVDAAGFESEEDEEVDDEDVEDFDEAGELLDDEPRLSFR